MITVSQAIILGLTQGISELFPISSLGHSVLLPGLLGWNIDQHAESFLEFLVATHLATAIVLFIIYFKDWVRIIKGMLRSLAAREIGDADPDAKLGWLLVVSTIPAGFIGLLLKDQIRGFLLSPRSAASFLILNGLLLLAAEWIRVRALRRGSTAIDIVEHTEENDHRIACRLSWRQSFNVGIMQVLALLPGFSRTGTTLSGSLMAGLSHEDALRYSFLLATPIIGAAALLEIPPLLASHNGSLIAASLWGAGFAAFGAWFAVRFLTRHFKTHTLRPFAFYCLAIGIIGLLVIR